MASYRPEPEYLAEALEGGPGRRHPARSQPWTPDHLPERTAKAVTAWLAQRQPRRLLAEVVKQDLGHGEPD